MRGEKSTLIQRLHRAGLCLGRQVRVPQRHLQVRVPQQFPDSVEVDPGYDQPAGEVVPHVVPPEALDARILQQATPRALAVENGVKV